MIEGQIFRAKLGEYIKTCMACSEELMPGRAYEFGLCDKHWEHIVRKPSMIEREYGRGVEFQLLQHTDELDDILYRLEYDMEPDMAGYPVREESGLKYNLGMGGYRPQYLIYAHYVAKLFIHFLEPLMKRERFDYITFADSQMEHMEIIFLEMGYLCLNKSFRDMFLSDPIHNIMAESLVVPEIVGKRVLLLDIYRSHETRSSIDRLKLSGASEVVTVYLTSYS